MTGPAAPNAIFRGDLATPVQVTFASLRQSTGFWVTLGFCVVANVASAVAAFGTGTARAGQAGIGFPFPAFIVDVTSNGGRQWQFYWTGWLLDILVALTLSVLVAALQRLLRRSGRN